MLCGLTWSFLNYSEFYFLVFDWLPTSFPMVNSGDFAQAPASSPFTPPPPATPNCAEESLLYHPGQNCLQQTLLPIGLFKHSFLFLLIFECLFFLRRRHLHLGSNSQTCYLDLQDSASVSCISRPAVPAQFPFASAFATEDPSPSFFLPLAFASDSLRLEYCAPPTPKPCPCP